MDGPTDDGPTDDGHAGRGSTGDDRTPAGGRILTLNAGSSSIKFAVYENPGVEPRLTLAGQVERIGTEPRIVLRTEKGEVITDGRPEGGAADHAAALTAILSAVDDATRGGAIAAVGHRVVHGGPRYDRPVILDDAVIEELSAFSPFAPLHQPHNLAGVAAARAAFPGTPQVACFDTAFHRGHPWVNDVFALPRDFYDRGVRRYGFHGLSYDYISGRLARLAPTLHAGRVVVAHLGNGASMCAMQGGRSVGSTMGFSALDGLPMGTRCGQLDPGVLLYLLQQEAMSVEAIVDLLYKRSGLLGLSGLSNDMRTLEAATTREAAEAVDYFVFRIRRELGALAAVLGGLDAVVFTGGIGEHSATIRARVCEGMGWFGIELDRAANAAGETVISTSLGRVRVMVLPTDEEWVIARAAAAALSGRIGSPAGMPDPTTI
ncbi:MAG: acetate/propionate family kinase [Pseudomonadota bacterium]